MNVRGLYLKVVLTAIAIALLKLAFFSATGADADLVGRAHAGSLIEWEDSRRIVTTGPDGSTTYVWDYDEKTKVRRYMIKGDKLTLETFRLE
jgi:hypothetical protein